MLQTRHVQNIAVKFSIDPWYLPKMVVLMVTTCLLVLLALLPAFVPCVAQRDFLIEAESFIDPGGWIVDPQFVEQMGPPAAVADHL